MKRCLGCMTEYDDNLTTCPRCGYEEGTPVEEAIHMVPGTKLHDRYTVGKVIGYGGFGVTYIAWDTQLQQKVAIKEYLPTEFSTRMPGRSQISILSGDRSEQFLAGMKQYVEEARKLAAFQGEEGIVNVYDTFEENNTAYIIMEYLDGETLESYLKENGVMNADMAVDLLLPVMKSLTKVHESGILHRDISPDNIYLTKDGKVKLIDFGAARFATTTHSRSLTVIIKPGYSPEEQYDSRGDQGPWTDVYALGAVLYKMTTGVTPPDALERHYFIESKHKDELVEPGKLLKSQKKKNKASDIQISEQKEIAILNALNLRVEDRTKDMETFIRELTGTEEPVRLYNHIKKLDLYRMPLFVKIGLPIVLAGLIALAVLFMTGVFDRKYEIPDGFVKVPDIMRIMPEEAKPLLEAETLSLRIGGNVNYSRLEDGIIVYQSPMADALLERNQPVSVKVNIASLEVEEGVMPYVVTFTVEEAKNRILDAGLDKEIEIIEEYSDDYEEGIVMEQDPERGTSESEFTKIILKVSKGSKPFELTEDVIGMQEDDARKVLEALGLTVRVDYIIDEDKEPGEVTDQDIKKGSMVRKGDAIVLTVVADEKDLTEVPDVTGMKEADAEKLLKDADFKVEKSSEASDTVPEGSVIRQSLTGMQKKGSVIIIYVSTGAESSVEDQSESPAENTLEDEKNANASKSTEGAKESASNQTASTTAAVSTTEAVKEYLITADFAKRALEIIGFTEVSLVNSDSQELVFSSHEGNFMLYTLHVNVRTGDVRAVQNAGLWTVPLCQIPSGTETLNNLEGWSSPLARAEIYSTDEFLYWLDMVSIDQNIDGILTYRFASGRTGNATSVLAIDRISGIGARILSSDGSVWGFEYNLGNDFNYKISSVNSNHYFNVRNNYSALSGDPYQTPTPDSPAYPRYMNSPLSDEEEINALVARYPDVLVDYHPYVMGLMDADYIYAEWPDGTIRRFRIMRLSGQVQFYNNDTNELYDEFVIYR